MKDDDFSGIVRSGAKHSVSVSERTGNAKTPKNIVTSHEEETEKRKLAFEQHELDALDAENPLADNVAVNLLAVPSAGTAKGNAQTVSPGKVADNRQALASQASSAENLQSLTQDNAEANRQQIGKDTASPNRQDVPINAMAANNQTIATDPAIAANVQNVSIDSIGANQQEVAIEVTAANRQAIATDKASEANVQNIPVDAIAANQQKIDSHAIAANQQNIPADKVSDANRQDIPTDVVAKNLQDIPVNNGNANQQAAPEASATPNRQTLEADPAHGANLQALSKDDTAPNHQTIPQDGDGPNHQGIANDQRTTNDQPLPKLAQSNNKQALDEDATGVNKQTLAVTPSIDPNHQPVEADAPILNRQAAPEDAPPGINRQGVDHGKIEDHFEALPSEQIERAKVDFSSSIDGKSATAATPSPSPPQIKVVRPPVGKPAPTAALSPQELQAIKLKREKMMEEFHGRVAGIKHNVDALNDRLTDFEEKVHKEDAKLIKGDPDHFKVDL
jgi:hypothetical protein